MRESPTGENIDIVGTKGILVSSCILKIIYKSLLTLQFPSKCLSYGYPKGIYCKTEQMVFLVLRILRKGRDPITQAPIIKSI